MVGVEDMALIRTTVLAILALATGACTGLSADPLIPADVEERIAAADGVQAEILDDGLVTREELEQAAEEVEACLERQGVQPESFEFEAGDIRVRFSDDTPAGLDDQSATYDRCVEQEFQLVVEVFRLNHRQLPEDRAASEARIIECINDRGFDVDELNDPDIPSDVRRECTERVELQEWDEIP